MVIISRLRARAPSHNCGTEHEDTDHPPAYPLVPDSRASLREARKPSFGMSRRARLPTYCGSPLHDGREVFGVVADVGTNVVTGVVVPGPHVVETALPDPLPESACDRALVGTQDGRHRAGHRLAEGFHCAATACCGPTGGCRGRVKQVQEAVHVVGHHHELVQNDLREMRRDIAPAPVQVQALAATRRVHANGVGVGCHGETSTRADMLVSRNAPLSERVANRRL